MLTVAVIALCDWLNVELEMCMRGGGEDRWDAGPGEEGESGEPLAGQVGESPAGAVVCAQQGLEDPCETLGQVQAH